MRNLWQRYSIQNRIIVAIGTVLCLLCLLGKASVLAEDSHSEIREMQETVVSPIAEFFGITPEYPVLVSESESQLSDIDYQPEAVLTTEEEIIEYIRNQFLLRNTEITFQTVIKDWGTFGTDMKELFNRAMEHRANGAGNEGDYSQWSYGKYVVRYNSAGLVKFSEIWYYSTAVQEAELTGYLNTAYANLGLSSLSDYQKVVKIHDYLIQRCSYVSYGGSSGREQYTAYGAIMNQKAVCQGYAAAFYRMCMDNGIDCRMIVGDCRGNHAWNIVKLGSYYYNVDVTFDDPIGYNSSQILTTYFLQSNTDFNSINVHTPRSEFLTAEFRTRYPIAPTSYVPSNDESGIPGLRLSTTGTQVFTAKEEGYEDTQELITSIKNVGGRATGTLTVTLTGSNPTAFFCATTMDSINPGSQINLSVYTKKGLAIGTYRADIVISGSGFDSKSFSVEFRVKAVHVHSWSFRWTSDSYGHWHECVIEECSINDNTQKQGYSIHSDHDNNNACDVCGQDLTIAKKGIAFVEGMYQKTLGRGSDASGLVYWLNGLNDGTLSGSDLAKAFIFSDELTSKNLSDDAFLKVMYAAFFGRDPDESGYQFWMSKISQGMSRKYILSQFVTADEYERLCKECNISMGAYVSDEARDRNENLTKYVVRCYTEVLGRTYDAAGLNYWTENILNGNLSAQDAAITFVHSPEFVSKNLNDTEYVEVLYRTFFGREGKDDTAGFAFWMDTLSTGTGNRESVLQFFANSDEFRSIMNSYGVQ